MKKVLLVCPTCNAIKTQSLPEQIMQQKFQCEQGIIGILVPEKSICEHVFIVYIDKAFNIRERIAVNELKEYNKRKLLSFKDIDDILSSLKPKTIKNILEKL